MATPPESHTSQGSFDFIQDGSQIYTCQIESPDWPILRLGSTWFDMIGFGGDTAKKTTKRDDSVANLNALHSETPTASTPLLPSAREIAAAAIVTTRHSRRPHPPTSLAPSSTSQGDASATSTNSQTLDTESEEIGSEDIDSSDWDSEAEAHDEDDHLFFSAEQRDVVYRRFHTGVNQTRVMEALDNAYSSNLAQANMAASNITLSRRKSSGRAAPTLSEIHTQGKQFSPSSSTAPATVQKEFRTSSQVCNHFQSIPAMNHVSVQYVTSWSSLVYRLLLGIMIALYGVFGAIFARDVPGKPLLAFSNLLTSLLAAVCLYLGAEVSRAGSMRALIASTLANEHALSLQGGRVKLERKFKHLITQALAAGLLLAIWGCIADQSAIEDLSVFSSQIPHKALSAEQPMFIHEKMMGQNFDTSSNEVGPLGRLLAAELELEADLDEDNTNSTDTASVYSQQLSHLRKVPEEQIREIPFWLNLLWRAAGAIVNLIIPSCVAICCCYIAVLRVRVRSAARAIDRTDCTVDHAQQRLVDIEKIVEHLSHNIGTPLALVLGLVTARFITLTLFIVTESPSRYVENSILSRPSIMFNLVALPASVMMAVLTSLGALRAESDFLLQVVNRFYVLNSSLGSQRSTEAEHLLEYSLTAALQPTLGGAWKPAPESAITVLFSAIMFYATMLKWKYRQFL